MYGYVQGGEVSTEVFVLSLISLSQFLLLIKNQFFLLSIYHQTANSLSLVTIQVSLTAEYYIYYPSVFDGRILYIDDR